MSHRPLLRTSWFAALLVAMLLLRLPHMLGPLDDPHSWRQCDTAEMTRTFAREGIDLLHPSVDWLGGHRTLIFEFPIAEAIAALPARLWGWDPVWNRLVALLSTGVAALYLHRILSAWTLPEIARIATVIFAAAPLVQFYSRAAHVDPFALAAAHGFLFHSMRSVRGGGVGHAAVAAVCGALAAMVKVPYLIPVLGPWLWLVACAPRRARWPAITAMALTAFAFVAWRGHVRAVNSAAPDWFWLPGYYKEVDPWWWYIGNWSQRLDVAAWSTLASRLVWEVATPLGVLLVLLALRRPVGGAPEGVRTPLLLWAVAAFGYMLLFFPLNVIHNYYQLPFAAPMAVAVALGVHALSALEVRASRWLAVSALFAVLLSSTWIPIRRGWYRIDHVRVAAGEAIRERTPAQALVVVVDRGSEYTDPRLLHRADRRGWAIRAEDLQPELLMRLTGIGATHVAWVEEAGDPRLVPATFLEPLRTGRLPLTGPGTEGATLHLYSLGPAR